ncbi:MAG: TraB family protein [Candidatus Nanoarchaeia archaeon]|nr:TraB family protein [Candidatus Nanoarchaeia archaeon]
MRIYKNIILIGTSHISKESIKEVESTITAEFPDLICLELDSQRLPGLISNQKRKLRASDVFRIGFKGFLFNLIGAYAEKKLGEVVNVKPGSEMKKAYQLARKYKIKLALIDQPINITLKRLSKSITFKEKMTFIKELITSPFKKQKLKFDLTKVPNEKIITELLGETKKKYPSIYRTLITERNEYMAKSLYKLMFNHNKIVAIIGAGHEKEIIELIKNESNKKRG